MSNLAPVPAESSTCSNCNAQLVPDQRYCLSCGQPCSPVRLPFLDVLSSEQTQLAPTPMTAAPLAYAPYIEPPAGPAWLRRYAPLFAVASVLLLAMIIGLLVGHWVTQSKPSGGPQVIKVEGLSASAGTAAAASTTPARTTAAPAASTSNASASKEEKQEEAEAKSEEAKKVAPPAPVKVSSTTLNKLETSTGKQHQEELNKIGTAPIAVP
jgi:uncharacterized protein (DUF4415 family)